MSVRYTRVGGLETFELSEGATFTVRGGDRPMLLVADESDKYIFATQDWTDVYLTENTPVPVEYQSPLDDDEDFSLQEEGDEPEFDFSRVNTALEDDVDERGRKGQ